MEWTAANYLAKLQPQTTALSYGGDGLFGGTLLAIWQQFYYWKHSRDNAHRDKTLELVGRVFENLNNGTPQLGGASLSVGAAGFGYVVSRLQKANVLAIDLDQDLAELDAFMYEAALQMVQERYLDFWHGAFGVVFYFLDRCQNPTINQYLQSLIEAIIATAQYEADGTLWFPNIKYEGDENVINLSLSHGQAAFLILLIKVAQKGIATEQLKPIIESGVAFIQKSAQSDYVLPTNDPRPEVTKKPLKQTQHQASNIEHRNYSQYPSNINRATNEPKTTNRLALCYGDLGVALLYYHASDFLKDEALKKRADLLGLSSLLRKDEASTAITDAHLCHGAAGTAQLYKSLYKLSKHEAYKDGYKYWIDRTLYYLEHDLANNVYEGQEGSLLTGLVGIELTLLAYISREQLDWDKIFLL